MMKSEVKIASERAMRAESKNLVGDNLKVELGSFIFPVKGGLHSIEVKNVPTSYTPDLWQKISDMLSFNDDKERR